VKKKKTKSSIVVKTKGNQKKKEHSPLKKFRASATLTGKIHPPDVKNSEMEVGQGGPGIQKQRVEKKIRVKLEERDREGASVKQKKKTTKTTPS